jgi:hypothetical protein
VTVRDLVVVPPLSGGVRGDALATSESFTVALLEVAVNSTLVTGRQLSVHTAH